MKLTAEHPVTVHNINTQRIERTLTTRAGHEELAICARLGDNIREHACIDRNGNPLRIFLQTCAPDTYADTDLGAVYEFTL